MANIPVLFLCWLRYHLIISATILQGGSEFIFAVQQEDRTKLWTARHRCPFLWYPKHIWIVFTGGINLLLKVSSKYFCLFTIRAYYADLALRPGCRSLTTDVCVPISALPQLVRRIKFAVFSNFFNWCWCCLCPDISLLPRQFIGDPNKGWHPRE